MYTAVRLQAKNLTMCGHCLIVAKNEFGPLFVVTLIILISPKQESSWKLLGTKWR